MDLTSEVAIAEVSQFAHRSPKLSVVMPVYNERKTIEEILVQVCAVDIDKEIIVVDDGSTDGSRELLEHFSNVPEVALASSRFSNLLRLSQAGRLRIVFQPRNKGKGAALRRGFNEALGDIVIIQDADLELSPSEYSNLIAPIEKGLADVVYGSRFLGKSREDVPLLYYLGNKVLTVASNVITGLKVTDVWTGYKVFRRDLLQQLTLREDRFGFEPEVTARIARSRCRIVEVPVSYASRSRSEGKKIGWKDAVRGIWCTFRYSLFG
jgi:glycosyltransferase involved in cell wall biosynthesis